MLTKSKVNNTIRQSLESLELRLTPASYVVTKGAAVANTANTTERAAWASAAGATVVVEDFNAIADIIAINNFGPLNTGKLTFQHTSPTSGRISTANPAAIDGTKALNVYGNTGRFWSTTFTPNGGPVSSIAFDYYTDNLNTYGSTYYLSYQINSADGTTTLGAIKNIDNDTNYGFRGFKDTDGANTITSLRLYGYTNFSTVRFDNVSFAITSAAPTPAITALTPAFGGIAGTNTVTITGTGFTGATAVSFGGVAASFTLVNDTTISATVPAGSGVVNVSVTGPGGTSADTAADDYTYVAALTAIKLDGVDVTAPVQQRSTVRSLTLDFNAPVTALTTFAAAITVTDDGGVAIPGLSLAITSTGNSLTIAFTDADVGDETGPVRFNSLADGRYRLSVNGGQLTHGGVAIDADGNGTAGGIRTYDFHRFFGDTDGDESVGLADLTGLQAAFGEENGALDFDNDGTVGLSDLLKVQENLGNSL